VRQQFTWAIPKISAMINDRVRARLARSVMISLVMAAKIL
jgi:hypothetical protein